MAKYVILALCIVAISATAVVSGSRTDDPIGVAVSPQALLLGFEQGGFVVVHTDVPYSGVDVSTLTLNGVAVESTKADDCGCLVAYFDEDAIKALVAPPSALMTLCGAMEDGTTFSGSDTVKVFQK